jgi:hypothetical protein
MPYRISTVHLVATGFTSRAGVTHALPDSTVHLLATGVTSRAGLTHAALRQMVLDATASHGIFNSARETSRGAAITAGGT